MSLILLRRSSQPIRALHKNHNQALRSISWMTAMASHKTTHVERTAREPREDGLYPVTVGRVDQINDKVRLFRLDLEPPGIKFLPGQWIDLHIPSVSKVGGFTITSSPTLASSPSPHIELAVQTSPSNPPAEFLFRPTNDILGSQLRVRIGGGFTFPSKTANLQDVKQVVFVAGGMGVNPLMSMLSHVSEGGYGGLCVKLVYAVRMPKGGLEEVLFLDRTTRLFAQGKIHGSVELFITESTTENEAQEINGCHIAIQHRRLNMVDLKRVLDADKSSLVYVCGPPTMTDELVEQLTSSDGIGMDSGRVLTEKWW